MVSKKILLFENYNEDYNEELIAGEGNRRQGPWEGPP